MPKVLLTGASGHLGQNLIVQFRQMIGYQFRILVLPKELLPNVDLIGIEIHRGNLCDPSSLLGMGQDVDLVLHMAGIILSSKEDSFEQINNKGCQNLLDLMRIECPKAKIILISSISVLYPRLTQYAHSKLNAESLVSRSSFHWIIIRPGLLVDQYGGAEFNHWLNYLRRSPMILLPGGGQALKAPLYMPDFADLLKICMVDFDKYQGQIVYATGSQRVSLVQFAQACLVLMGRSKKTFAIPILPIRIIASIHDYFAFGKMLWSQALAGFIYPAVPPESVTFVSNWSPKGLREFLPLCFPRKEQP